MTAPAHWKRDGEKPGEAAAYDEVAGARARMVALLVREMDERGLAARRATSPSSCDPDHVMPCTHATCVRRAADAAGSEAAAAVHKAGQLIRLVDAWASVQALAAQADRFFDDDSQGYDAAIEIIGSLAELHVGGHARAVSL